MTPLPNLRTKLLGDELLPEHLLKGKRAYEQWATAGGTVAVEEVFPYDDLSDLDRQRWVFFAKAYGDPRHDHNFRVKSPQDVERYPGLVNAPALSLFEYDEAVNPMPSSPLPVDELFYRLWVDQQKAKVRAHWWQWRRPTTVDISRLRFRQELSDYRKTVRPEEKPVENLQPSHEPDTS